MSPLRPARPWLLPLLAPALVGFDYGVPIYVLSEADIYELEYAGDIEEQDRDQLLAMLQDPLDLNRATRDELQQLPEVTYALADAIIARRRKQAFRAARQLEALVGKAVWRQCRPFVLAEPPAASTPLIKGSTSLRMLERFEDQRFPVLYVKSRNQFRGWLDSGVLLAEEPGVYGVEYGADGVSLEGERPRVSLERVHLGASRGAWSLIAGHYMAGFGQSLTFDVTDRARPHGFYHDLKLTEDYENYDSYSVSRRLLGLAVAAERALDQGGSLELTLFGSCNPHDLYYTYISPNEYQVRGNDEVSYPSFPWVYREDLLGLHSQLSWVAGGHVGLTAWGGRAVKAYDFDFTATPIPNRPWYGAAGLDLAQRFGLLDLYGEAAVTDQGAAGALAEAVLNPSSAEVSLLFRYYGTEYDNPHSRPAAEPDTLSRDEDEEYLDPSGKRDRDELGPQLKLVWNASSWLRMRLKGDLWRRPSLEMNNLYLEGRLDLDPLPWLGLDLLAGLRDKDISTGGRAEAYDVEDPAEERGSKSHLAVGLRLEPVAPLLLQVYGKESFEDSTTYDESFERSHYLWVRASWELNDALVTALRFKLYDERPEDPDSGMRYAGAYAQLLGRLPGRLSLQGRYEQLHDLDDPAAEIEHKLKLGLDLRY